ncbi:MAG: transcriptional regulator [Vulcanimicrobiaceae bacterium]
MNKPVAPFACDALDKLFHERGRLAVCTCLIANAGSTRFTALQEACGLTDGNLNRHLHALAETGIVKLKRVRDGNRYVTTVCITADGKARFLAYVDELEAIVRAVNATEPARASAGLRLATQS